MFYENTMFSILKIRKQKIFFVCQTFFLYFYSAEQKTILKHNSQIGLNIIGWSCCIFCTLKLI